MLKEPLPTGALPTVEVSNAKEQPKRRSLADPPRADSVANKKAASSPTAEEPSAPVEREPDTVNTATLLSDIVLPPSCREPRVVVGQPVVQSEELTARLKALADMVGKDNVAVIRTNIQRDLDGVAQLARTLVVPSAAAAESQVSHPRIAPQSPSFGV